MPIFLGQLLLFFMQTDIWIENKTCVACMAAIICASQLCATLRFYFYCSFHLLNSEHIVDPFDEEHTGYFTHSITFGFNFIVPGSTGKNSRPKRNFLFMLVGALSISLTVRATCARLLCKFLQFIFEHSLCVCLCVCVYSCLWPSAGINSGGRW